MGQATIAKTPLDAWIAAKIGIPPAALTQAAIERYQLVKLRETLQRACRFSPFYRRRILREPESIRTLDDIRRLPLMSAADIADQPLECLAVSQSQIKRVVSLTSSGTTGPAKRLFFTAADQALTIDFFQVGMSTLVSSADRVLILLPGDTPGSVGDLLATALGRLGAKAIVHGPVRSIAATLACMQQEAITALVGVPVQVLALARHPFAQARPLRLKSVLLSTDHVPAAISRELRLTWGCEVFEHYGMTEMGLGGGVDCAAHQGYHLREADLYVEIVDPVSGEPVKPGEEGEIVFTTLTRQGMPLIRYRTGDISRFLAGPCPCKSVLRRLAYLKARKDSEILINGQKLTLAQLDEALFAIPGVIDFSATVDDRHKVSSLNLSITTAEPKHCASLITAALEQIPAISAGRKNGLTVSIAVNVAQPNLTPLTAKRTIKGGAAGANGNGENYSAPHAGLSLRSNPAGFGT